MRRAAWIAGAVLAVPLAGLIALAVIAFPASLAVAVVLGMALGTTFVVTAHEADRPPAQLVRIGAEVFALTALAVLAVTGLIITIGPAAGFLLVLAPFAAAGVVWQRRTQGTRPAQAAAPSLEEVAVLAEAEQAVAAVQLPALEPVESLPGLATDRLCLMWRRSYAHLEHARSHSVAQQTVAFRQHILDELERRNADGFSRWLDSGARAAGNPSPYVTGLS